MNEPERKHGIYEVKDGPEGTFALWKQGRPIRFFGRNELHLACRAAKMYHDQDEAHEKRMEERRMNMRHLRRGEVWKIRRW